MMCWQMIKDSFGDIAGESLSEYHVAAIFASGGSITWVLTRISGEVVVTFFGQFCSDNMVP